VKPIPPVYSAEKVANALTDLVRHPRREIIVGASAKVGLLVHAIAPALAEQIFAKQVEQRHFDDRPAPPSEGNLFRPMKFESIAGGWRATGRDRRFSKEAWFGAAALATGIGLLLACGSRLRSRRSFKLFHKMTVL
jgi:hypothetical protein